MFRFNFDGPQKSDLPFFQKTLWASYQLNCSQTNLATDLPMVRKFKFVHCGHIKKKFSALCASVSF